MWQQEGSVAHNLPPLLASGASVQHCGNGCEELLARTDNGYKGEGTKVWPCGIVSGKEKAEELLNFGDLDYQKGKNRGAEG